MAYQNVGTPRFYIDVFSTMKALDIPYTEDYKPVVDTPLYKGLWGLENCSMPNWNGDIHHNDIKVEIDEEGVLFSNLLGDGNRQNVYIALLNCKIGTYGSVSILPQFSNPSNILGDNHIASDVIYIASPWSSNIANFGVVDVDTDDRDISVHIFPSIAMSTSHIGAISMGNIYDMPVSPDLDLSMNIEFDGFDNTQTLNGGKLTNKRYMGSPWWFDVDGKKVEPWSVGESTGVSKRNGRRTWNLKFSYMSDKDLFASNYGSSTYLETATDVDPEDIDDLNLGQSILTNGDFSAGTTGWYFADCSGTIGTYFGFNNVCQIEVDSPDTVGMYQVNVTTEDVTYKYSFDYYIPSGNTNLDAVQLRANSSSNNKIIDSQTVTDTWTSVYAYYTPTSSATDDIWIYLNSTSTGGDDLTVGNSIYVKNIKIEPVIGDDFQYTIDDDDSFSAQVLNKISHGQKFIFQPDNTNNNPDQFAICVLDQDSFSMKRTAHNVYDISMKIKEVW